MPASDTAQKLNRLKEHSKALGCSDLVMLGAEVDASQLEYLDLLPKPGSPPLLPDAVAEFQGRPLLYLVDDVDEDGKPHLQPIQIRDLQTLLANRSEHACLGVVRLGSLEVYPINIDRDSYREGKFPHDQDCGSECPDILSKPRDRDFRSRRASPPGRLCLRDHSRTAAGGFRSSRRNQRQPWPDAWIGCAFYRGACSFLPVPDRPSHCVGF